MASILRCNICAHEALEAECEQTEARSNVRAFRHERFALWRCPACRSIHARDQVDLPKYYRAYPFHELPEDWRLHAAYRKQLRRLRRAGLRPNSRILDFGCGGGSFVRYLRTHGYKHTEGYDEFSDTFGDASVLERRYDVIVSQDVVEHVPEPLELFQRFDEVAHPGAVIAVGTPEASVLDLQDPERCVHTLHQPYHRHIFSKQALIDTGTRRGWSLQRYYDTMYTNTLVPFVNTRFLLHYLGCFDDTLDVVAEPIRVDSLRLWSPLTFFYAFFGYFMPPHTDVMAVFRKSGKP